MDWPLEKAEEGRALVIGAGIVGTCCALELQRAGLAVTLLDRDEPGRGCSFGNAGIRPRDAVAPIASPGTVWRVPGYLSDPEGPLRIRWSYLPRLMPWLLRFVRAGGRADYERLARSLTALVAQSGAVYAELLAEAGAEDLLRPSGALQVFETEAGFKGGLSDAAFRRSLGGRVEVLGPAELRQQVPVLAPIFAGAVFRPDVDYVRDPFALTGRLLQLFLQRGGKLLTGAVAALVRDGGTTRARLADGELLRYGLLVVAAGAWSGRLLRTLSVRVPLDTERGYHVALPHAGSALPLPVSSGEGGFYATPMAEELRIAGTVEFAGLDAAPDHRRGEAMLRRVRRWLPDLDCRAPRNWMGFRPSLPDSLPAISPVEGCPGLYVAFGHGHLGLTLAAATGRAIADLALGRKSFIDVRAFSLSRF